MIDYIATSNLFTAFGVICSIVGLLISVVIMIRTKRTNNIINNFKVFPEYNANRLEFQAAFKGFRASIDEDHLSDNFLKLSMLDTLLEFDTRFRSCFSIDIRIRIARLKHELKIKNTDFSKVSSHLTNICAYLTIDKEVLK